MKLKARSSSELFAAGVILMIVAVIVREVSFSLIQRYATYVGPGSDLQFSAATYAAGAVNAVLLPIGVGIFSASFVVAALAPRAPESDHAPEGNEQNSPRV